MRYIIVIIFLLLFVSCKKYKQQTNEIVKVELARAEPRIDSGQSISIDSSLRYNYSGALSKIKQGDFTGKISQAFWDTLNQKFSHTNYKRIRKDGETLHVHASYFEMIIYWKGGVNMIFEENDNNKNDSLLRVIMWLDSSYKSVNLQKANASFSDEEMIHLEPPKPKVPQLFPHLDGNKRTKY